MSRYDIVVAIIGLLVLVSSSLLRIKVGERSRFLMWLHHRAPVLAIVIDRIKENDRFFKNVVATVAVSITAASFFATVISGDSSLVATSEWKRETIVVLLSLSLIVLLSGLTIYFTPSRMTVIAGISVGFIIAVLLVEAFLWLNGYMTTRVEEETAYYIRNILDFSASS